MPTDHLIPPRTEKTDAELVKLVAESRGEDVEDMLELASIDSVSPGICTICLTIHDSVEPDAEDNACEECDQSAVKSVLILANLI